MKRLSLLHLLLALNVVLLAAFLAQWFDDGANWREPHWSVPQSLAPDLSVAAPRLPRVHGADPAAFAALLDRPVFSPTRRPPVPPPVVVVAPPPPPPPPDPLATAQLVGLYGSGSTAGGALIRLEGKVRRVVLGDAIAGWTLRTVGDREVRLERGAESKTLTLQPVRRSPAPRAALAPAQAPLGTYSLLG